MIYSTAVCNSVINHELNMCDIPNIVCKGKQIPGFCGNLVPWGSIETLFWYEHLLSVLPEAFVLQFGKLLHSTGTSGEC